jgi:hypothetical protein
MREETLYTTLGDVRGGCGHAHRSLEAAIACRKADHKGCVSQGGYSDRQVYTISEPSERHHLTLPPEQLAWDTAYRGLGEQNA